MEMATAMAIAIATTTTTSDRPSPHRQQTAVMAATSAAPPQSPIAAVEVAARETRPAAREVASSNAIRP